MTEYRIVEFEDGNFALAEMGRDFFWRLKPNGDYVSKSGRVTWCNPDYVDEYCKGTLDEILDLYLKTLEQKVRSSLNKSQTTVKRVL